LNWSAFQLKLITDVDVIVTLFCRLTGQFGGRISNAPFPAFDSSESPYTLTAIILALTLSWYTKLYGDEVSVAIGKEQFNADT